MTKTDAGTLSGVEELEQFIERTTPPILKQRKPPEGLSDTEWEEVRVEGLHFHQAKASYEFALLLGNGWTPREVAADGLDRGTSVDGAGQVHRPPEPRISASLEQEANLALQGLARYNITIPGVLMQSLEQAAGRSWFGPARPVEDAVGAAAAAVRQVQAEMQAAQAVADDKVTLHVRRSFRPGGNPYPVGSFRITREEAADLERWQAQHEATAKQRRWAAPEGFEPDTWPPFTIEEAMAVTT